MWFCIAARGALTGSGVGISTASGVNFAEGVDGVFNAIGDRLYASPLRNAKNAFIRGDLREHSKAALTISPTCLTISSGMHMAQRSRQCKAHRIRGEYIQHGADARRRNV